MFAKKVGLMLVVALTVMAVYNPASAQQPPTVVVTEEVREMDFHDQITLVGRTEAWISSRIVSEVAGQVKSIDASEGNPVSAGTPLATIDSDQIRFLLDAKKAQARQAKLEADLAHTNLKRVEELFSQNLVSQSAMDSSRAWAGIMDARYEELEAQRKSLERDLKNCTISAMYNGYTGQKLVDVGEWVNPGEPVFEMVDLSKIRVKVDLPERYFGNISTGAEAEIVASGNGGEVMRGEVTGIAPNANAETHTFPVIIEVENTDGKLGGGMLVRTSLWMDNTFKSLAVSKDAIIRQGDQTMVYTVNEGKAAPIQVITSSTEGKMIAVKGQGLVAGMPVVVRGNERIFPGSPVMTADASGQPGADKNANPQNQAN